MDFSAWYNFTRRYRIYPCNITKEASPTKPLSRNILTKLLWLSTDAQLNCPFQSLQDTMAYMAMETTSIKAGIAFLANTPSS